MHMISGKQILCIRKCIPVEFCSFLESKHSILLMGCTIKLYAFFQNYPISGPICRSHSMVHWVHSKNKVGFIWIPGFFPQHC